MSLDDFMDLTPLELYEAIKDDSQRLEYQVRIISESIRYSTSWLVNVQLPKSKRIRNVKRFMQFPWERIKQKIQNKEQTPDQMKAILKTMAGATKHLESKMSHPRSSYSAFNYKR